MRRSVAFSSAIIWTALLARAQAPTGEITGTVVDSTGAVVAGGNAPGGEPPPKAQRVLEDKHTGGRAGSPPNQGHTKNKNRKARCPTPARRGTAIIGGQGGR